MREKIFKRLERMEEELAALEDDYGNEICWNDQNDCELLRIVRNKVAFAYEVFGVKIENPLDEVDYRDFIE